MRRASFNHVLRLKWSDPLGALVAVPERAPASKWTSRTTRNGAASGVEEQDFYDLCFAYLTKAASQNVLYAEMFFDPQQHVERGIPLATVIGGLTRAQKDARRKLGIDSQLVMCFMRELSADSAMAVLESAQAFKRHLVGVGLDSDERDNPPDKFRTVFAKAKAAGSMSRSIAMLTSPTRMNISGRQSRTSASCGLLMAAMCWSGPS